jgi:hypothetical protein
VNPFDPIKTYAYYLHPCGGGLNFVDQGENDKPTENRSFRFQSDMCAAEWRTISVARGDAKTDRVNLFDEMDAAADTLRANNPDIRTAMRWELQMEFRQLQQARMPELTREQAAELFGVWLLHDLSRLMAVRDKTLSAILASIDEAARLNGPGQPFGVRVVPRGVLR